MAKGERDGEGRAGWRRESGLAMALEGLGGQVYEDDALRESGLFDERLL